MNIWVKMMTALRGGVSEIGEAIVDSQVLRILDQEVRGANEELKLSRQSLAEIIARQKVSEEKTKSLAKQIDEYECYVFKALDQDDESLAREIAEKIAGLESQLLEERVVSDEFSSSANQMRTAIQQTERNLKRLKQQVDTVKATETVQRAQAAVAERHNSSDSKMRTAIDSLERIKEKQSLNAARMAAASELAESTEDLSLQAKLEAAGIIKQNNNADEVLLRLKNKRK